MSMNFDRVFSLWMLVRVLILLILCSLALYEFRICYRKLGKPLIEL